MSFPNPATQFRPGEEWRGNPGGRPKGRSLTALIREVLDSNTIKGKPLPEGRTVADVLAEVFVAEALKGKFPFAKEVIDRIDGKVVERVEVVDAQSDVDPNAAAAALKAALDAPEP